MNIGSKESPVEYTERQRKLREGTRAQRDAYRKSFFGLMSKEKADRYNQEKLKNEQRKLDQAEKRENRMEAQMWLNENYRDRQMTLKERTQAAMEAYRQGLLSLGAARIAIAQLNANTSSAREERQSQGSVVTTTDERGKTKKVETRWNGNKGKAGSRGTMPGVSGNSNSRGTMPGLNRK